MVKAGVTLNPGGSPTLHVCRQKGHLLVTRRVVENIIRSKKICKELKNVLWDESREDYLGKNSRMLRK